MPGYRTIQAACAGLVCVSLVCLGFASLPSAPVLAQTTPPASATQQQSPAKDSLRKTAWDKIAGNWKRLKGSVKQRWGKLTHDEIRETQGRREALNGFIQSRYGIDREAADRQIDDWLKAQKAK
jgi:uncharacterized protein YjbJ (UPF0337 family)